MTRTSWLRPLLIDQLRSGPKSTVELADACKSFTWDCYSVLADLKKRGIVEAGPRDFTRGVTSPPVVWKLTPEALAGGA